MKQETPAPPTSVTCEAEPEPCDHGRIGFCRRCADDDAADRAYDDDRENPREDMEDL